MAAKTQITITAGKYEVRDMDFRRLAGPFSTVGQARKAQLKIEGQK